MNKRKIGAKYETAAAAFLAGRGYRVLEKNYRCRAGEIDLVAKDGAYLVFVEVKYRRSAACGSPLEAVDERKRQRMIRSAQFYLLAHGYGTQTLCRFDVVAVCGDEVTLVQNAFDIS